MTIGKRLQIQFRAIWNQLFSFSTVRSTGTYAVIVDALPICGVCQQPISSHHYQQIASATFKEGNEENLKALDEALRSHDWQSLSGFQEWEGLRDNVDVILLRCPDGRYNLTAIYDPFELTESSSLIRQQEIDANELPAHNSEWKSVTT